MARPKGLPKTGGRQKGTVNKVTQSVKEVAGQYTQEAIEKLVDVMRNTDSDQACVAAIKELLDRGHGKSKQAIDVEGSLTLTHEQALAALR